MTNPPILFWQEFSPSCCSSFFICNEVCYFPFLSCSSALVEPTVLPSGSTLESTPESGSLRPAGYGLLRRWVFVFFFIFFNNIINICCFCLCLCHFSQLTGCTEYCVLCFPVIRLWLIMERIPPSLQSSVKWTSSWRLPPTLMDTPSPTAVWVFHTVYCLICFRVICCTTKCLFITFILLLNIFFRAYPN